MKCTECDTEMFVQRQGEELINKCPNPACKNFGYGQKDLTRAVKEAENA